MNRSIERDQLPELIKELIIVFNRFDVEIKDLRNAFIRERYNSLRNEIETGKKQIKYYEARQIIRDELIKLGFSIDDKRIQAIIYNIVE